MSPALPASRGSSRAFLRRGRRLLLYTDGVSDALAGDDGNGEDALLAATEPHAGGGAAMLESILTRARERFGGRPQPDDLTLLTATMRRRG